MVLQLMCIVTSGGDDELDEVSDSDAAAVAEAAVDDMI